MRRRLTAFAGVGAMGFAVQLAALALLILAGLRPVFATCIAVEAAVLHNFAWHERWTWADRAKNPASVFWRLVRFNVSNGLASLVGSALLVGLLVNTFALNVVLANLLTVGTLAILNFLLADKWVFAPVAVAALALLGTPAPARAAEPSPETLAAWNSFVKATEAKIHADLHERRPMSAGAVEGDATSVRGGLINHWTGTLFVEGVTLDAMLARIATPGTPPPSEDVLDARVMRRLGNDYLHTYLKLTRRTIVTATYETEHDVTIARLSPTLATSRSVSTRIAEIGGGDRGFMWRLNSYWRYEQVTGGVLVEMESLTLSRSVPAVLRPVAMPIVSRVARESVARTLAAFNSWFPPARDTRRRAGATGSPAA